jgi:hypothetical protein
VLSQLFDEVLVAQAVLIELMDGVSLDDAWLVFREPRVRVVSSAALRKIAVGIPMPPQLGAGEPRHDYFGPPKPRHGDH